jgi:hypothetical protein
MIPRPTNPSFATRLSFAGCIRNFNGIFGVKGAACQPHPRCAFFPLNAYNSVVMARSKERIIEVACPDCAAMLRIDASTGLVVSHTPAPRKRMFEDLETAAKAMREHEERKESIFRQSLDAEKNKADLLEKKFAEAVRKAKDAPDTKPLREFDLD